jgi:signal transduction histidine kinase
MLSEQARISAGNQLKEVFLSLLKKHSVTRKNIKEYLKQAGLDTSFTINYSIRSINLVDFDRIIPVYNSKDTAAVSKEKAGLYLRSYRAERDHFSAEFDLYIDFTRKAEIIINEMRGLLIIVILTIFIVLAAFIITLRSLWKQKKLNTLKSDFIDNISHEFKTPLSSISLAATTVKHPKFRTDSKKVVELADTILHQNKTLNQMIDQVIDVSLIENQKILLSREKVDVLDYLERIKSQLIKEHPESTIRLDTQWSIDDDLKIEMDKPQIDRVLRNIFSNAVKYSNGKVEISMKAKELDDSLVISVSDKGIGIEKEILNQIFNRFYRAENGRDRAKGLGLGLYIVKRIVEAHNGSVSLESTPGKGTCVSFRLPKNTD